MAANARSADARPALAQDRRVDAARQRAQVLHRGCGVVAGLVQGGAQLRIVGQVAREAELEQQAVQARLDAVVEVALDADTLVVGGRRHARARRAQRVDQLAALLGQTGVVEQDERARRHAAHDVGRLVDGRVVGDESVGGAVANELQRHAPVRRRGRAVEVAVERAGGVPAGEGQRGIAQRLADEPLHVRAGHRGAGDVADQAAQAAGGEQPPADLAGHDGHGDEQDRRRHGGAEHGRAGVEGLARDRVGGQRHEQRAHGGEQRAPGSGGPRGPSPAGARAGARSRRGTTPP